MTADPAKRPDILELCQLMVPVIMDQLDTLRTDSQLSALEVKQLKEKHRDFAQTNTTQFGFRTVGQGGMTGGFVSMKKEPSVNDQDQLTDMKMVQVNSEQLKSMNKDPVAGFLDTVNQMQFVINLPPTLDKDIRQI